MDYIENKEKFYSSEYATQIVDNGVTGIPFFFEDESGIYDAFLFYSVNVKNSCFNSAKMLILVNTLTGEIKSLTKMIDDLNIENNFNFEIPRTSNIDEKIILMDRIEETYIKIRNNYVLTKTIDRMLQEVYLNLVRLIIPNEIIEKVYKVLSPNLFVNNIDFETAKKNASEYAKNYNKIIVKIEENNEYWHFEAEFEDGHGDFDNGIGSSYISKKDGSLRGLEPWNMDFTRNFYLDAKLVWDISKMTKKEEITSKELEPSQLKGIKAFFRKMLNKLRRIK